MSTADLENTPHNSPSSTEGFTPRVAIIGGTGLYTLPGATVVEQRDVPTPYGTAFVTLALLESTAVAFISRHGRGHKVAPQQINYRANLWALKSLGVEAVISSAAVGSLSADHPTGSFALADQFIDVTHGRGDTFYNGALNTEVAHLPAADPFCPGIRSVMASVLADRKLNFAAEATVAVINGPRFSTRAESTRLKQGGAHLVSMTQYPEPVLAAELNMGFATLAFITDADTGHDGSAPVTAELVFERLGQVQETILAVLAETAATLNVGYTARQLMPARVVDSAMSAPVVQG